MFALKIFNQWLWREALPDTPIRVVAFGLLAIVTIVASGTVGVFLNDVRFLAYPLVFWLIFAAVWLAAGLAMLIRSQYREFREYLEQERNRVFNILKD